MTEPSNTPEQSTPPNAIVAAAGDARFVLAVGLMLVLIIGMLAFLWQRERKTRVGLESDLAQVRKDAQQRMQALQGLMGQAAPSSVGGVEPFSWLKDRDAAPAAKAVVDGLPYAAVRITGEAGERLGFRPGDVICVSAAGATDKAASAPAPARP